MADLPSDQFMTYDICGLAWNLRRKYEHIEHIAGGTYGDVSKCLDKERGVEVAIKRMKNPFLSKAHAKRALRELKLLKFCQHDNLLSIFDAYTTASSPREMIDLYLITPWMDMSLTYLIEGG